MTRERRKTTPAEERAGSRRGGPAKRRAAKPRSSRTAHTGSAASRPATTPRRDAASRRTAAAATTAADGLPRCGWAETDALMRAYHDTEWGVPSRDDRFLFEKLLLDGAQAGLSWRTILHKREGYRRAFAGFDPEAIARFTPARIEKLLLDPGIVRNRLKVESAVANARAFLALRAEGGSLAELVWSFVDGRTVHNRHRRYADAPAETEASRAMSKELRGRGFRFVGPTICYAFMQAAGLVNDHEVTCHRHAALRARATRPGRRRRRT